MRLMRLRGHTLVEGAWETGPLIIDAGAHRGEFGLALLESAGNGSVLFVEANPALAETIPTGANTSVFNVALGSSQETSARFFVDGANAEASRIGGAAGRSSGGTVVTVEQSSLGALLSRTGLEQVDVLKLDVEGAEIAVLLEASDDLLRRIDQITIEFHDFCGFVSRRDVMSVQRRLRGLGFTRVRGSKPWRNDDVLFVGDAVVKRMGVLERFLVLRIAPAISGLGRLIGKAR